MPFPGKRRTLAFSGWLVVCLFVYYILHQVQNSTVLHWPWEKPTTSSASVAQSLQTLDALTNVDTINGLYITLRNKPASESQDLVTSSKAEEKDLAKLAIQANASNIWRAPGTKVPERIKWDFNVTPAFSSSEDCDFTNLKSVHTAFKHPCLPEDLRFFLDYERYSTYNDRNPDQTTKVTGQRKLIVNINRMPFWFQEDKYYENVFTNCEYSACKFTDDQNLIPQADAVFATDVDLHKITPPRRHSMKQIWINYVHESPANMGRWGYSSKWRKVFNWTMGYQSNSDIFMPYGYLAFRSTPSLKNYTSIALRKTKSIAWFVSHCDTDGQRELYAKELQKYIDVDIYGACSDKKCEKGHHDECRGLLTTTYYFYLSFENSLCKDYVTEKFLNVFTAADTIPIVRGGTDYSRYFLRHTFINTADFSSPQNLAIYLKTLTADPLLYARMLKFKDQLVRVVGTNKKRVCDLCKHLHLSDSQHKVTDLMEWTRDYQCYQAGDF